MNFSGKCDEPDCKGTCNCLVDVELFIYDCPASDYTGRMCYHCGKVRVIGSRGEIVTKEIPGLRIKFPLFRNKIPTGKVAFWVFETREIIVENSDGTPVSDLYEIKLPYFKNNIPSGKVLETKIAFDGIIGGFQPHT